LICNSKEKGVSQLQPEAESCPKLGPNSYPHFLRPQIIHPSHHKAATTGNRQESNVLRAY
jgi:hypothetical protein